MLDLYKIVNEENGFNTDEISLFKLARANSFVYNKTNKEVSLNISIDKVVFYQTYKKFLAYFENSLNATINIQFNIFDKIPFESIESFIRDYSKDKNNELLRNATINVVEDNIIISFDDEKLKERAIEELKELEQLLLKIGIKSKINYEYKEVKKSKVYSINDEYKEYLIKDIKNIANKIKINAYIFKIENSATNRTGRGFNDFENITYYLKDGTGAFLARRFVKKDKLEDSLMEFNVNDYVCVYGDVVNDKNKDQLELHISNIISKEAPIGRVDSCSKKRVELHAHTKLSEFDGVSEPSTYIDQAIKWGWNSIAFTDHMVVQAYPLIQKAQAKASKGKDIPFKAIYGIEMNMVDPVLNIVKNADEESLNRTYVVFDLETTGLSNRYDHIIEFGGVKIQGGAVIDRLQTFIKPPVKLEEFTKNLTNITDTDVENAPGLKESIDRIMSFFDDCCLVAHNAKFDIGFINAALVKLNRPQLSNPYIDTLDLSRALLKERKSYRLGKVASFYKVEYDEDVAHRADYDAEVTGEVFTHMLNDIKNNYSIEKTCDLQKLSDENAFKKVNEKHVILLAKNQEGIKDIFKLVTLSHTDYLVFGGKVSTKSDEFIAEARITREEISKKRENLIIGSACCNGEIFDLASTQSKEMLKEAIKFYDYIEVQPLENYRFLVEQHSISSVERLKQIITDIIECADEVGVPVCATGDAHYVNPEEKIFRDVYIQAPRIGGAVHPLYIYNPEVRHKTITPNQHLRTTGEMLEAFNFLSNDKAFEIVVDNTNMISDQIDICYPCKDKLYPPSIDGADDKLKELCYKNAYERYGNPLPELVRNRLEKELNSILSNGYGVIYYTAHLMVKDSNDHGYMVGSRGSVGSSFVATMADISEVNPLAPHYVCSKCHHFELIDKAEDGFDYDDKPCPNCGEMMHPNGHNIPFETFLGFYGDKVPDIDLNFSSDYQAQAMLYTREVFGDDKVFRAGTIGAVQEKTAYGYIRGYCEKMGIEKPLTEAEKAYLAIGCAEVKRTTGQHPGGIIVIPKDMDVHDFTPVQYPANNPDSEWKTTHLQFADIHDNVLKLDNLGHVDPTVMKLLEKVSGIDIRTIPMNDPEVIEIFKSPKTLKLIDHSYNEKTGALGTPEFGTRFVRGILSETHPSKFSDLVRISGLSHGTDVWSNNAKDLVAKGKTLNDVIGCRDDIMITLIEEYNLPAKSAFDIMESVRKGKGLKDEWMTLMREHNVPEWYIDSCLKIKYMFPKGHAVAYVMMAVRVAWFKVHYPLYYYISFFTLRCDAYEISTMIEGQSAVKTRLEDILSRQNSKDWEVRKAVTNKEVDLITTLEVTNELYARGFGLSNLSLKYSLAQEFVIDPDNDKNLIPSFVTIDGLGYNVAKSIVDARNKKMFISKKDLADRTGLSKTLIDKLDQLGVLEGLDEENQMSLF